MLFSSFRDIEVVEGVDQHGPRGELGPFAGSGQLHSTTNLNRQFRTLAIVLLESPQEVGQDPSLLLVGQPGGDGLERQSQSPRGSRLFNAKNLAGEFARRPQALAVDGGIFGVSGAIGGPAWAR